jgi:transcriptional regulator
MYIPSHFAGDEESAAAFLATIERADLVTITESGLVATFLPLLFLPGRGERGALIGHVARKNDHWRLPALGESLVIAHGEDAYISPSWYASKAEHGRVVPTWNYTTAHVYGELVVHDESGWVDRVVRRLTERHETRRAHPWSVDDAPSAFHAAELRAIVGLELVISRVELKLKMSQNRPDADIEGVIAGLSAEGLQAAASAVRRLRPAPGELPPRRD